MAESEPKWEHYEVMVKLESGQEVKTVGVVAKSRIGAKQTAIKECRKNLRATVVEATD